MKILEAVLLMDKDSKSKCFHIKKKKKTKLVIATIEKWNKKVNDLQMAVDWLGQNSYFLDIVKKKNHLILKWN